jgi:hypothetical protein
MRRLNKTEQDLCTRIQNGNGQNNYLGNIIDDKLNGVRISITRTPPNVDLLFTIQNPMPTKEEAAGIASKVQELSKDIVTTVNLISMLEKEGYIMLLQQTNVLPNQSTFGRGVSDMPFISTNLADKKISDLLIEYSTKEIIVTEEFNFFVKHNFNSRDEQRFRRQIFITKSALIVAVLALLINTFFNLLPKFTGGTKIKQEQIDSLRVDLKAISGKLESLVVKFNGSASKEPIPAMKKDSAKVKLKRLSVKKGHAAPKN